MSNALSAPITLAEFLAWEDRQEFKHEFDGMRIVAMNGVTVAHSTIEANLAISIGGRLRGTPCRFYGSNLRTLTDRTSRYPDGVVTCTAGRNEDRATPMPVVVFEILSRSTAGTDRLTKNREYEAISSIQRYVMLEQDRIEATVFARAGTDWLGRILGDGDTLSMPEIGIEVPLAELYAGLTFSPDPET